MLLDPGQAVWIDVVVPRGDPLWHDDVAVAAEWLGATWVDVLADLGLPGGVVHRGGLVCGLLGSALCFAGTGPGEVTVDGAKVVGISQRRTRAGARFQCSVPLAWDPTRHAALLAPGIERVAPGTDPLEAMDDGGGPPAAWGRPPPTCSRGCGAGCRADREPGAVRRGQAGRGQHRGRHAEAHADLGQGQRGEGEVVDAAHHVDRAAAAPVERLDPARRRAVVAEGVGAGDLHLLARHPVDRAVLEQADGHREQHEALLVGHRSGDEGEHVELALGGGVVVGQHVDEVVAGPDLVDAVDARPGTGSRGARRSRPRPGPSCRRAGRAGPPTCGRSTRRARSPL